MTKDLQKSAQRGIAHGILDPTGAAQHFVLKRYQPSPDLVPFIEQYWVLRWDLQDRPPYVTEALTSPDVSLAFMTEGPRLIGVMTGKFTHEIHGAGVLVRAKFKPGGFHPFWYKAVADLRDRSIPAAQVFPGATETFNGELLALADDMAIVARVEKLLRDKKPVDDAKIALIGRIISFIEDGSSIISVPVVARHFGMSERALQNLFQVYVGVGPKWAIMRYRLREAAERATDQTNWTQIAADLGYSSQQHFSYDFKKIIGKSPREYSRIIKN